ncbi:hypothetical protein EMIHUDRAFT_211973 [Emiliania huxleyi CCMP1516]|uniref:Uncharacterized protein n=2 Tax=Emiliania huxleyi TaxID=2903 RepID=A0A0D3IS05_EMIH1|nr:hypothetical protein EMIHUDRAFT_211973 [Emiliania huxleyi CCMP1516]EOD14040.1 hypothetical protein EMIHUDRAFT_211973 [Emiliania huxleyi CCMP1516]|eukprot:XP_005766469.1 hypothetical protein EMIHUDRAFT_211973 [Emiliania huxleyi CCMP1516]
MAHSECLAKRLGATCLAAADERLERGQHGPGPAVSAGKQPWERVCVRCKDNGFAVDQSIVRCVPRDELLALRPKGGSADGFRDAPASYAERFKYCLINDSGDLSRAEGRTCKDGPKHKDVSQDGALVLLHPDSPLPPPHWVTPSAADYGQPEGGPLELSVMYKTFVPLGRGSRRPVLATQRLGQRNEQLSFDDGIPRDILPALVEALPTISAAATAGPSTSRNVLSTSWSVNLQPVNGEGGDPSQGSGAQPARKRPAAAPVDDLVARASTLQISGLSEGERLALAAKLKAVVNVLEDPTVSLANEEEARNVESALKMNGEFEPDGGLQLRSAGASRRSERGGSPSAAKQEPSDESSDEEEAIVYRSTRR